MRLQTDPAMLAERRNENRSKNNVIYKRVCEYKDLPQKNIEIVLHTKIKIICRSKKNDLPLQSEKLRELFLLLFQTNIIRGVAQSG